MIRECPKDQELNPAHAYHRRLNNNNYFYRERNFFSSKCSVINNSQGSESPVLVMPFLGCARWAVSGQNLEQCGEEPTCFFCSFGSILLSPQVIYIRMRISRVPRCLQVCPDGCPAKAQSPRDPCDATMGNRTPLLWSRLEWNVNS